MNDSDEIDRLRGIIIEAEHLAEVEPGKLLWRIINMKDALRMAQEKITKAQDEAYERAITVIESVRAIGCTMDGIEDAIRALKSNPPELAYPNIVDNSRSSDGG